MIISALNYDYQVRRLALGITFEDALRDEELATPVRAEIEQKIPHSSPQPKRFNDFKQHGSQSPLALLRSITGRYSLTYHPGIQDHVDIRVYDYKRHYIPRRIQFPLITLAQVLADEANEVLDYTAGRVRHVLMFPGAAYHLHSQATGLRGRVLRDTEPMRWAYIEARHVDTNELIVRTRGDDRGEFLLVLPAHAAPASDLSGSYDVRIHIIGPALAPVPDTPELPELDNYWDLPLEIVPAAGLSDSVSIGESLPTDYVAGPAAERIVSFQVGRTLTGREETDFIFS